LNDDRAAPTNQPFLISTLVPPESYPQAPRNVQFTRTSITGVADEDDEDVAHGDDLKADPEKGEVRQLITARGDIARDVSKIELPEARVDLSRVALGDRQLIDPFVCSAVDRGVAASQPQLLTEDEVIAALPPWTSQITVRGFLMGVLLGAIFSFITMRFSLGPGGVVPTFNMPTGAS
jgi:hypothetical protein